MKTYNTSELVNIFKGSPVEFNSAKEVTLFNADDIQGMENVRQYCSGVRPVLGVYYAFSVFCGNPDIIEDAKHLYNFIVLSNKQIFRII